LNAKIICSPIKFMYLFVVGLDNLGTCLFFMYISFEGCLGCLNRLQIVRVVLYFACGVIVGVYSVYVVSMYLHAYYILYDFHFACI
jgi:hypothetical protein